MTVIGGLSDEWVDGDHVDIEHGGEDIHHQTGSFKLLTLHSLSGFFMMFGWVGLACTQQLQCNEYVAIGYALLAGFFTMMLTAFIFTWSRMLVSSGARFSIEQTVGLVGTVYQYIPGDGIGKIQVIVDGVTRELLARSCDGTDIESFLVVRIVSVLDYETVIVQKVE